MGVVSQCHKCKATKEHKYWKPLIVHEDRQSTATHWDDSSRRLKVVMTASVKMIEADHNFEVAKKDEVSVEKDEL